MTKTSRDYAPFRTGTVMPIARAALACGPLVPTGKHYRFGRRLFSGRTIEKLIGAGEAQRAANGSVVRVEGAP